MKIAIFALSIRAAATMEQISEKLSASGGAEEISLFVKCSDLPELSMERSLAEQTAVSFREADALIFICAAGIAVRMIAPLIRDKFRDPAVVVMDEGGRYCIPLLSGHMGGANELARRISRLTGAECVITTATDCEGRFSADDFAREHHLAVSSREAAKRMSVRVLRGDPLLIYTDPALPGAMQFTLPRDKGAERTEVREEADVIISPRRTASDGTRCDSGGVLYLIPSAVSLGIGCRRGTAEERIRDAVSIFLENNRIFREAVCALATIDLKADEPGLAAFSGRMGWPLRTFGAEELMRAEGRFSASSFVKEVTGADNVCERSAVLSSNGTLRVSKTVIGGITLAAAW